MFYFVSYRFLRTMLLAGQRLMRAMVSAGGGSMRQAVMVATGGGSVRQTVMSGGVTMTARKMTSVITPPYTVPKGPWGENR